MDITPIMELINTLGFPIVCCFVIFKQNNNMFNECIKQYSKISEPMQEILRTLVINNERISKLEEAIKDEK